jgi:hypothetical protein
VAVVYFRSGYEPAQYPSSKEWAARLMIERSLAIKCPSIHYHLSGTKKVQQTLATPGVLEKFLTDSTKVDAVKDIFTGLYSLDLVSITYFQLSAVVVLQLTGFGKRDNNLGTNFIPVGCILLHNVHVRISQIINQQSQLKDFLLVLLFITVSLHVAAYTGHPQVNTIYYLVY